jgi:putative ABC transport system substrate-binding protein
MSTGDHERHRRSARRCEFRSSTAEVEGIRRREVLAVLACALAHRPLAAVAQSPERLRVIGVLIGLAEGDPEIPERVRAFEMGLRDLGWVQGRNIHLHYRFAADIDRVQLLGKELLSVRPEVVVASSSFATAALLRETSTIPIVFVTASDPVGDGFVASLARPGGNVTGFTNSIASMGGKWLELLKEIAPSVERVAIMFNPASAPSRGSYFLPPFEAAAASIGVKSLAMPVHSVADIEPALAALGREPGGGLIVMPDTFTAINRGLIIAQAAQQRVPAIYSTPQVAADGGLIAYGADQIDLYRRTPFYVDRILKGAKPAELPVQSPTKFDLIINLKTAKALGLTVSPLMIARANEVIE